MIQYMEFTIKRNRTKGGLQLISQITVYGLIRGDKGYFWHGRGRDNSSDPPLAHAKALKFGPPQGHAVRSSEFRGIARTLINQLLSYLLLPNLVFWHKL